MWPEFTALLTALTRITWTRTNERLYDVSTGEVLTADVERGGEYSLIVNAYEMAVFRGCVVLAAPLTPYVSLATLNSGYYTQMYQLQDFLHHNDYSAGMIFRTVVSYTLYAALHFSVLARGFRPLDLWPMSPNCRFDADSFSLSCPWFLLRHTAFGLYHFYRGFINDQLQLNRDRKSDIAANSCDDLFATTREVSFAVHANSGGENGDENGGESATLYEPNDFGRIINVLRGSNVDAEYELFDDSTRNAGDSRKLKELATYLNLLIPRYAHLERNPDYCIDAIDRVFDRHMIEIRYDSACDVTIPMEHFARLCAEGGYDRTRRASPVSGLHRPQRRYEPARSLRREVRGRQSPQRYVSDDEYYGVDQIPATPPRRFGGGGATPPQRRQLQPNVEIDEADSIIANTTSCSALESTTKCPFYDITHNRYMSLRDKYDLTRKDMINILLVAPQTKHHDELLRFQLNGLCAFPTRVFSLDKHMRSLEILFFNYTMTLMINNHK